jgi:histidine triad (HIT) family protein
MEKTECVFCGIVSGKASAHIIDENEESMCILDINPYADGHCLVIPKRHVPWWHELTESETQSLFSLARRVSEKIMKAYSPEFVCMYARGRRVPHTHIFLIPTFKDDMLDRFFNALEKFQEAPEGLVRLKDETSLKQAADRLRGA